MVEVKEGEGRNDNILSPLVTGEALHDSRTARDFLRHAIEPQNPSDVHLFIQRDTSSEVEKSEHGARIAHLLGYPLASVLKIDSGSTHREGELGASIGQREGCGLWRRDGAESVWCVSDLGTEDLTVRGVVGLDQELH